MTVVNWYPGHMAKAAKAVKTQAALCDLILEIADARLPESSRNPDIGKYTGNKRTILVLNKCDLTEKADRERWLQYYSDRGQDAVFIAATRKEGFRELHALLQKDIDALDAKMVARGRRPRPLRAMMVGIPNTGKSALLNAMVGKSRVKTGDKPGLTRALQWVRTGQNWELLDSPGLLWPKLEDQEAAVKLAVLGSISKEGCSEEESGHYLLCWLLKHAPQALAARYKLSELPEEPEEALAAVAKSRGLLLSGGRVKEHETYILLLKEFRSAALGKFMLELPEELNDGH